ncbi:hypothetical protein EDB89DRAFT_1909576 [Lactarius sanguifluus]|nr:hypothetical protein EDB89DRAFT_1909576 [Lactarius sanguifluus]
MPHLLVGGNFQLVHFTHHATLGVMKTSDASSRLHRGKPTPPIEFAFYLACPCHVDELAKIKGQASVCPALKCSGIRHLFGVLKPKKEGGFSYHERLKKALLDVGLLIAEDGEITSCLTYIRGNRVYTSGGWSSNTDTVAQGRLAKPLHLRPGNSIGFVNIWARRHPVWAPAREASNARRSVTTVKKWGPPSWGFELDDCFEAEGEFFFLWKSSLVQDVSEKASSECTTLTSQREADSVRRWTESGTMAIDNSIRKTLPVSP